MKGQSITVKPSEYTHATRAFEDAPGTARDSNLPGTTIIDYIELEMEVGEFTALRLNDPP